MAKFDILYPDMKPINDKYDRICRTNTKHRCCICEDETEYFELNYEAHICSEECLKEMDDWYNKVGRAKHSEKSYWDWIPDYRTWRCRKCKWCINEKLHNAHPEDRGYSFCPNCGIKMEDPELGTVYIGD